MISEGERTRRQNMTENITAVAPSDRLSWAAAVLTVSASCVWMKLRPSAAVNLGHVCLFEEKSGRSLNKEAEWKTERTKSLTLTGESDEVVALHDRQQREATPPVCVVLGRRTAER